MTLPVERRRYTVQDYLRIERDSSEKHEYAEGEILAMSGGTPTHSLITSNVNGELRNRLAGKPCRAYDSNLRIRIFHTPRYLYPDAAVICGKLQFDPDDTKRETVINPQVIIEVLSPSTEAYDRGAKFSYYRELPSLEEYVLVSQGAPRVETFLRQADGAWLFNAAAGVEWVAKLRSLQIEIPLAEIFAGVEFPPPAAPPLLDASQA